MRANRHFSLCLLTLSPPSLPCIRPQSCPLRRVSVNPATCVHLSKLYPSSVFKSAPHSSKTSRNKKTTHWLCDAHVLIYNLAVCFVQIVIIFSKKKTANCVLGAYLSLYMCVVCFMSQVRASGIWLLNSLKTCSSGSCCWLPASLL